MIFDSGSHFLTLKGKGVSVREKGLYNWFRRKEKHFQRPSFFV